LGVDFGVCDALIRTQRIVFLEEYELIELHRSLFKVESLLILVNRICGSVDILRDFLLHLGQPVDFLVELFVRESVLVLMGLLAVVRVAAADGLVN